MALLGQNDGLMTQPDPFLREGFGQSLKFFEAVMVLDKHRSSSWCDSDAQSILPNRHNPWNRSTRNFRTWYYPINLMKRTQSDEKDRHCMVFQKEEKKGKGQTL